MIKIYTDGSCLGNPGNGGWAAIIFIGKKKISLKGSKKNTTNNQMELLAPIKALKKIPIDEKIEIFTDSKYLKLGITEWIFKWKKNGWKTSNKKKVKNLELWKELDNLVDKYQIKWSWVKAHSGNKNNEEVDLLARNAANLN
jgi:ribonuclease HI|tara:strand:- start:260 stop:685 length:426 start_codon:yes stop_codon:yes gene_type:complete